MNTTLCYIEREGKYLMLLRNKKQVDPSKGKWIGVGGKFKQGETADECMMREIAEETGFTVTSWQSRGVVHFISNEWEDETMHLYTVEGFEAAPGTPVVDGLPLPECAEGELSWIPKESVMKLNLWEGDRLFLRKLIDGDEDASMTLRYEGDELVGAIL